MKFYESLFSEQFSWHSKLDGLAFDSLDEEEAFRLEHSIEREVLAAVKGMNSDKALGSYGFSLSFFQVCWDVIKADIMGVFHDFHASRSLKKALMPCSSLSFHRNLGLLILRTSGLLVL